MKKEQPNAGKMFEKYSFLVTSTNEKKNTPNGKRAEQNATRKKYVRKRHARMSESKKKVLYLTERSKQSLIRFSR